MWERKTRRENRQFYEQLVAEEVDALHRTAYRLCGNVSEAEDLTQEVFLKTWRAIDKLRRAPTVRPWLYRVLRTTWIDKLRKDGRQPRLVSLEEPPEDVAPAPIPRLQVVTEATLYKHLDDEVSEAMHDLPEAERQVLLFATFGELSYKEIAEALECPIGTVMSRLHRARSRLQERLIDYATQQGILSKKEQNHAEA